MQIDLSGKAALVIGSTERIGYAVARQLAKARAEVVVNGRSDQKTAKVTERQKSDAVTARVTGVDGGVIDTL